MRLNFDLSCVRGADAGGASGCGVRVTAGQQARGGGGWLPAAESAIEPLGRSASMDFRNVLITL